MPLWELREIRDAHRRHVPVRQMLWEICRLQGLICLASCVEADLVGSYGNGIDLLLQLLRAELCLEPVLQESHGTPQGIRIARYPAPMALEELRKVRDTWRGDPLMRKLLWEISRLQRLACLVDQVERSLYGAQVNDNRKNLRDMLQREPSVLARRQWIRDITIGPSAVRPQAPEASAN